MQWLAQPLPAADYMPDMPALNNPGSSNIINCLPRTPQSYGPMPDIAAFAGALTARCQGAIGALDSGGNSYVYAGDANDLYEYSSASMTPTNVSQSAGGYATATDGQWKFCQFGQRVLATNFTDPVQTFTIAVDTAFSDLAAAAPNARYMDVAKGFLIVANTTDGTFGDQPQRVWWSGLNDPTNWPTPGTATAIQYQSSYNDLFGSGGWITGVVGNLGGADAAIFMEHQVWRMVYSGAGDVFDFFPAEGVRGTRAPNSLVHVGPYVYYLGEDGFYVFNGTDSKPIGANRVDKTFYAMFQQNDYSLVWGDSDPINKIVFWLFPSTSAIGGVPDTYLAYNWQIDKWSIGNVNAEILFRALTFGYTLDTLPGTLDSYDATLDSRAWTGGSSILAGFDTDHALSYFNGESLEATIETSEQEIIEAQLTTISDTRPLVDGGIPTVAVATRNRLIDPAVYGTARTINSLGSCPLLANGRYVRARCVIPAGSDWTHFQGIQVMGEANGEQ